MYWVALRYGFCLDDFSKPLRSQTGSTRFIFPGEGDTGERLLEARSPEHDNDERILSCNPTHQMKEKAKKRVGIRKRVRKRAAGGRKEKKMLTVSLRLLWMGWGRSRSVESRSSHPLYLWRSRNFLVLPWDTVLNVLLLLL